MSIIYLILIQRNNFLSIIILFSLKENPHFLQLKYSSKTINEGFLLIIVYTFPLQPETKSVEVVFE
jgi:hypothetical protein